MGKASSRRERLSKRLLPNPMAQSPIRHVHRPLLLFRGPFPCRSVSDVALVFAGRCQAGSGCRTIQRAFHALKKAPARRRPLESELPVQRRAAFHEKARIRAEIAAVRVLTVRKLRLARRAAGLYGSA